MVIESLMLNYLLGEMMGWWSAGDMTGYGLLAALFLIGMALAGEVMWQTFCELKNMVVVSMGRRESK